MYANHFGFRCLPFEDRADAQFYFSTPEREETLAAMEYEAHFGFGILVIGAEAGMGKTLLVRTLAGRLDASDRPVILQWQAGAERSLIRECCKGFGVSIPSYGGGDRAVARLSRHVTRTRKSGHQSLLIVDQAENLSSANLAELSLLAELEDAKGRLLPIILVGQPKLVTLVQDSSEETLKQCTREVRGIGALSASESAAYIEHRLAVAGVAEGGTFTSDAISAIHQASEGVPRLINRMTHDALVAAYGAGRVRVDGEMIAEITAGVTAGTRSVPASEMGLRGTEHVTGGWRSMAGSSSSEVGAPVAVTAQPPERAVSYENGAKPPAHAYGGDVDHSQVFADADEFYDRLSQTVSRSERATASTEMTLAKVGAVEQHLDGLLGRAEAVIAALGGTVQEGEGLADHIKRRLNEIASETEQRVERMEARALRTGTVASDVEEQIQRIEEACGRAEDVERRLSSQAAQIADKAEDVQQQVATISETVSGSEDARKDMERLIARASAITGTAEEKLVAARSAATLAIEEVTNHSAKLEQRLTSQVSLITGAAEEKLAAIRGSVKSVLDEVGNESVKAEERLTSQVSLITGAAEEKLAAIRGSVKSVLDEAGNESVKAEERLTSQVSLITGAAEEKLAAIRGSVKSVLDEAGSESVKAEQRLVAVRAKLAETVEKAESVERELADQTLARCRQKIETELGALEKERSVRLESLLDEYRHEQDSLCKAERDRLVKLSQEIDAQLERMIESARGRVVGAIEKLAGRIEELKNDTEEVEARHSIVASAQQNVSGTIDRAETQVAKLSDCVRTLDKRSVDAKTAVDKLVLTASTVTDPLVESITRGETLIDQTEAARGNLESMLDKVGSALIQTGRACEQAEAARAKAAECEKIVARFDEDTKAGRAIAERLETLVPACKDTAEELACALCGATDVATRLAGQTHDASATAEQLERGVTQGQEAIDRITAAAITAEQAVESVQSTSSNLQGRHESAARLVGELDSLNATARQLHEALQGVVAHADEKTGRLGSQSAAASNILKQLADANIDIHGTLKQAMEMQRKIEALTKDVWSLTTKSENCVKALSTKAEAAERITAKLGAATEQVQPLVSDLSSHVTKAIEFEQRLACETTKAGDIVERIDNITGLLKQANELNESVGKTVDDARTVGAELSAAMEQILPQYQQMQETYAAAQGVIETSTQLKSESDSAVERFIENLQASQQVIEEVETQAGSLDRQMQKAKKEGDRIEQHIEALMVQPKKLLDQAQSQSTQLERVCDAVRKVFANLAKTSLEAKERTGELQMIEQQATQRLEQLVGETNATTQMLNQWVQEAIHAQARLQQTVERIPSTKDTHPGDRLRRLSMPGQPVTRIANPSAHPAVRVAAPTDIETARLVKAANESKSKVASDGDAPPSSGRAAEIARMIEEAKKAQVAV